MNQRNRDDPVAQGNALIEALRQALGVPLFAGALHYSYGVDFLYRHLQTVGPLIIALTGAEHAPDFAQSLFTLHRHGSRVVLALDTLPETFVLPEDTLVLDQGALQLTAREALALADGRLRSADVYRLLQVSQGAYQTFLAMLCEALKLPVPSVPTPMSPVPSLTDYPKLDLGAFLNLLEAKGYWFDALELAVMHLPERVPKILWNAGHLYHQRGLHQRLWELLESCDRRNGTVLFWRLTAAVRLGMAKEVRGEVERYLRDHEAPELRALYAGNLAPYHEAELQAERAYRTNRSSHTLYQYGRLTRDTERGVRMLHESVRLAELGPHPYEVARNAGAFTARLTALGRYREAARWGTWALEFFDKHELGDAQRRLLILNNVAFARILTGETVGLEKQLMEGEQQLPYTFPLLMRLFRSTLADHLLITERVGEALHHYHLNWAQAERTYLGKAALGLVRALLENNQPHKAIEIAERAYYLTKKEHEVFHRPAALAYGLAQSLSEPQRAIELLEGTLDADAQPLQAHRHAQATLYLAKAYFTEGEPERARAALLRNRHGFDVLADTGVRLLSGPEAAFREVWSMLHDRGVPLELRFLGQQEVWWQDERVALPQSWQEVLVLLALNPSGLWVDQLLLLLSGERGSRGALQTTLSRLRKVIPVSEQPLQLEAVYEADFLKLQTLLERGEVRRAVALYRGPLFEVSGAPGIAEAREALEESVKQAVMSEGDAEVTLNLAETLEDDLELWEAALEALPSGHTRAPLVRARVNAVRKSYGL